MARNVRFKQADVSRALKGAKQAGMNVGRVEVEKDGKIVVIANQPEPSPQNHLDKWLEKQCASDSKD